jgi:chaperonin GroES
MKYQPRNDYVLVEVDEPEEKSRGGILLPEKSQEEKRVGTVLDVGIGKPSDNGTRTSIDLKAGQKVVFNKFSGQELGDRLLLIKDEGIIAVIND